MLVVVVVLVIGGEKVGEVREEYEKDEDG